MGRFRALGRGARYRRPGCPSLSLPPNPGRLRRAGRLWAKGAGGPGPLPPRLTAAELGLKDFRLRTAGVLPAGVVTPPPSPAFTNAFELRVTRDQLGHDRQAIDRFLAQPDSGLSADALVVIDAVQKSPELMQALKELTDKQAELRALRYTYTDQNFPVQQLADAVATLEHRTIPALLRAVRDNLAVRERDVSQRVDSTVRYLSNIPPLLFEQTRLEREVQVAGQLYASLQQHHDEARVA